MLYISVIKASFQVIRLLRTRGRGWRDRGKLKGGDGRDALVQNYQKTPGGYAPVVEQEYMDLRFRRKCVRVKFDDVSVVNQITTWRFQNVLQEPNSKCKD